MFMPKFKKMWWVLVIAIINISELIFILCDVSTRISSLFGLVGLDMMFVMGYVITKRGHRGQF
jgi:hypothetical protein